MDKLEKKIPRGAAAAVVIVLFLIFAFGLLTRRMPANRAVPYIAVASPLLCFAIDKVVGAATRYRFGYELLMLNGMLTFAGLWLSSLLHKAK